MAFINDEEPTIVWSPPRGMFEASGPDESDKTVVSPPPFEIVEEPEVEGRIEPGTTHLVFRRPLDWSTCYEVDTPTRPADESEPHDPDDRMLALPPLPFGPYPILAVWPGRDSVVGLPAVGARPDDPGADGEDRLTFEPCAADAPPPRSVSSDTEPSLVPLRRDDPFPEESRPQPVPDRPSLVDRIRRALAGLLLLLVTGLHLARRPVPSAPRC